MAQFLTTASTLTCPHGGTVVASPSNTRARAAGAFVVSASDSFTVIGCPFTTASSSPCGQVIWSTSSLKNSVGAAALTEDNQAICLGPSGNQGNVVIAETQREGLGE